MSIELILGSIGTLLGVANFVYWAWLAKRDKVAIVTHDSWANFVPKGKKEIGEGGPKGELITVNNHSLHIYISCALVLTRGETEIEALEVEVKLHKKTCEELKKYFRIPNHNGLILYRYELDTEGYRALSTILQPKKPVDFTEDRLFECTDKFEEKCKTLGFNLYPETDDYGEYTVPPDFIKPLLEQLGHKYQICWTRYDGKKVCWHFPDKWWRNLGKKLWG